MSTDVRTAVEGAIDGEVGVTGAGATVEDYFSAVYDKFPYVLALIAIITFILLVRTFRSILLPIKAVILNLVSLAAVFGCVVFFWQEGHGSEAIFNVSATGAITFWLPVLIFAFLFGLSMDYEVFILARMREEYDECGDTEQAVITGLGRTGRLVTSAALILFFAFAALASAPGTDIKVLGTALGVGILIDATHRSRAAGAGVGHPVRPMELVAARWSGSDHARRALATGSQVRRTWTGPRSSTGEGALPHLSDWRDFLNCWRDLTRCPTKCWGRPRRPRSGSTRSVTSRELLTGVRRPIRRPSVTSSPKLCWPTNSESTTSASGSITGRTSLSRRPTSSSPRSPARRRGFDSAPG